MKGIRFAVNTMNNDKNRIITTYATEHVALHNAGISATRGFVT